MSILVFSHPMFAEHDTGAHHPERPARLGAAMNATKVGSLREAIEHAVAEPADLAAITRVHPGDYASALDRFCAAGGGHIDGDTVVVPASWEAARLAAGAGLAAIERLDAGDADAAFCVVRPPGHHATPTRAMGFCLVNNVAVAAMALADRGERVLIVDYDAHHGNGTQDVFYGDPRVFYVSFHQHPMYPGTGALDETGAGEGIGTTLNVPMPAGSTGDRYLQIYDEFVSPAVEQFQPTWVLLSAGFDAHRADPLTGMGLTSGDIADLTKRIVATVPAGHLIAFLEGGYDLDAVTACTGAAIGAMIGVNQRPEPATSGGPGEQTVTALRAQRDRYDH